MGSMGHDKNEEKSFVLSVGSCLWGAVLASEKRKASEEKNSGRMRARIGGSRHLAAWRELNWPEVFHRGALDFQAWMDFRASDGVIGIHKAVDVQNAIALAHRDAISEAEGKMIGTNPLRCGAGLVLAISIMTASTLAFAAGLPKATDKVLKDYKLDESILAGLDKELDIPASWIEAAKKEGTVKILDNLTDAQFRDMTAAFRERYPFIKPTYSQGTYQARTTRVLVAFKAGNFPYDVNTDFGGFYSVFQENGVLADLRDLPIFPLLEPGTRGEDGSWIGYRRQYWCAAYNTKLVKKENLPKTWEDLVENPAWRNKNLALGNRPQLWILMLWNANGEEATRRFVQRLFGEVRPQLRMEGMDMLPALAAAGEFSMIVPTSEFQAQQLKETGAPLDFHCPEPIPATVAMKGIIKGSPNLHAAKIYLNWLMSKEGQIHQARVSDSIPVRADLQRKEFIPFPDEIVGKKTAFRSLEVIETLGPTVQKFWNESWSKAGGPAQTRSGGGAE